MTIKSAIATSELAHNDIVLLLSRMLISDFNPAIKTKSNNILFQQIDL